MNDQANWSDVYRWGSGGRRDKARETAGTTRRRCAFLDDLHRSLAADAYTTPTSCVRNTDGKKKTGRGH